MIARLRGRVAGESGDGLILDVNGVGYLVHATGRARRSVRGADEVTLEIHTVVREDALALYGFADADERELFQALLGVSGIGPKVALAIVSGSTPAELRRAIVLEDTARFEAIPGIGKKTAQRVVLELREKVSAEAIAVPAAGPADGLVARDALVELGYSVIEAERALAEIDPELPAEERVRLALKAA
jgi:holliday junction DNA helicase RuvA